MGANNISSYVAIQNVYKTVQKPVLTGTGKPVLT